MAQNETWLKHDLLEAVKVQYLDGNLFSMDNAGNLIGVTLTRDGEDYSGGGSVSANVIRSDGGTVAVTGALSGKTATVVLPQAAYAVPGVVSIIVKLTASGQVTTIAALVANVYRSSTDTAVDPGTIIPSIQTLISQINTAVASIPADYSALWTKLAPAFSTSASYVPGQYVTYNSGLYRFNTTHTGDWSSSDVTAVNLGGEISDLKSALDTLYNSDGGISPLTIPWRVYKNRSIDSTTGNESGSDSTVYCCTDFINVAIFESITYKRIKSTGSTSVGLAFYDKDKTYISGQGALTYQSAREYADATIVLPVNACFVRFSMLQDSTTYGNFSATGSTNFDKLSKYADQIMELVAINTSRNNVNLIDDLDLGDNEFYDNNNGTLKVRINSNASTYRIKQPIRLISGKTYSFANTYYTYSFLCQRNTKTIIGTLSAENGVITPAQDVDLYLTVGKSTPIIGSIKEIRFPNIDEIYSILKEETGTLKENKYIAADGTVASGGGGEGNSIIEFVDEYFYKGQRFMYSGEYIGLSLVWGYKADGTAVALLGEGTYKNKVIALDSDDYIAVRAWSPTTRAGVTFEFHKTLKFDKQITPYIVVDASGYGDFTDIQKAIDFAKANFNVSSTPVTIFIRNGVYTLSYVSNKSYALNKGANRISLIGESREGTQIVLTSTPAHNNKVLEIGGPCEIANLTIKNLWNDDGSTISYSNNSYCIHNDSNFNSDGLKYTTVVRNCYIYSEVFAPIGAGLQNNQTQMYIDCVIEFNNTAFEYGHGYNQWGCIYIHGPSNNEAENCSVVIDGCTCIARTGSPAIVLPDVIGSLQYTDIPVSIRRTIGTTTGSTITDVSKERCDLQTDSALNNVEAWNY